MVPAMLPSVRALAVEFFKQLEARLTARDLRLVRRLNARQQNDNICHSHDFCDANIYMDAAFTALGVEMDTENDTHTDLWNEAWSYAAERFLCGRRHVLKADRIAAPPPTRSEMLATSMAKYHEALVDADVFAAATEGVLELEARTDVLRDMIIRRGHTDWVWLEETMSEKADDLDYPTDIGYFAAFRLAATLLISRHPQIEIPTGHWSVKITDTLPAFLVDTVDEVIAKRTAPPRPTRPDPAWAWVATPPTAPPVRHDPHAATAAKVIAMLADHGIDAHWESFTGHIEVVVPGGHNLMYGTANVDWQGHYAPLDDGKFVMGWDPDDLPEDAPAERIFAVLIAGYMDQIPDIAKTLAADLRDIKPIADREEIETSYGRHYNILIKMADAVARAVGSKVG